MKVLWCWRCKTYMPMLDEEEWARVHPVTGYTRREGSSTEPYAQMLEHYKEITGFHETNINAVFHHRISLYGPPCAACGKALRTPESTKCFECGQTR
ncbi:hypothetical protein K2D_37310 [Planctomycetes bacterium K2D]|nr:hypothetical protein K2D_37310 [Planctomycetes bacterium K2D]